MFYALTAALMVSSMALAQVRYEYESPEKADAPQAKVMKQNGLKPGVRVQTSGKASLLPPRQALQMT